MKLLNVLTLVKPLLFGKTDSTIIQLFRYFFVGGFAFLIDFGILFVLTEFLDFHYLLSATIAFLFGLITNYLLSRIWVFKTSTFTSKYMEFLLFAGIGLVGLLFTDLFMCFFTDIIGLYYMLSKVITTALIYLWNFFARKYLIFNNIF